MLHISAEQIHASLDYPALIEALRDMFRDGCEMPVRHHHQVEVPGAPEATLLLMPAWQTGREIGVKVVTAFPGNGSKDLPAIMGQYLLLDGETGTPRALLDGQALTARRTAAASALAAGYLARPDAARLLMVGTGALAPHLIQAHAAVRPIREVVVWGRRSDRAQAVIDGLDLPHIEFSVADDLAVVAGTADVVSCATISVDPLIQGDWLRPGQHLDLVGAFRPDMRESDDVAVTRARLFVDTRAGALKEGGDLAIPLSAGVISETDVVADLYDLTRGHAAGRETNDDITLFKSVGAALEDLAAAQLAVARLGGAKN
jgi:ornithine cyclodeaminase